MPRVADRLGAKFLELENYEVGNAVGAVTGRVSRRIEVLVAEKPEEDKFLVFLPDDRRAIDEEDEEVVMDMAEEMAREKAKSLVRKAGGKDIDIYLRSEPISHGRGRVHVTAVGSPELTKTKKFD